MSLLSGRSAPKAARPPTWRAHWGEGLRSEWICGEQWRQRRLWRERQQARDALGAAYADEPFVHLLPAGQQPRAAAVAGSNSAHLQVAADQDSGRIVVTGAIDNLGKGAAGQALQNANLMLGLPETAGLSVDGIAP